MYYQQFGFVCYPGMDAASGRAIGSDPFITGPISVSLLCDISNGTKELYIIHMLEPGTVGEK